MAVFGPSAIATTVGRTTGLRDDPYMGYNFLVEIQGLIAGGFTEVSGLEIHTEVQDQRQGGNNSFAYRLPGATTYGDLQLVRGLADIDMLWPWYQGVVAGRVKRRNGTIYLLNRLGIPAMWWNFRKAFPTAWVGPRFDAANGQVLFTTITLAHEGLDNPIASASGSLGGLV